MNAPSPSRGKAVDLTTERFRLRSLRPTDASERWLRWIADPAVMEPLNGIARTMPKEELVDYIQGFNDRTKFLVGVFVRADNLHIGFFIITIHPAHANATFNVVVGDRAWWGAGVVNEARAALLSHVFAERGVERATGSPLTRNFPALFNYKAQGWRLEGVHRGSARTADGKGRLDQYQFALLKEEWLRLVAATSPP